MTFDPTEEAVGVAPRTILIALSGFWTFSFVINTVRAVVLGLPNDVEAILRRVLVTAFGAALAWLVYRLLVWIKPSSRGGKIAWATGLSLPAGASISTVNYLVIYVITPIANQTCMRRDGRLCTLHDIAVGVSDQAISWSFVFAAWGMLYLSLASAAEIRASDRRAAAHREAARLAEIRALRYQINPHFLFNVLNTLSSQVIQRQLSDAEDLIAEIGRFFRYSLSADPVADSVLSDEIEMQARYLQLEQRRFGHRLQVRLDIAEPVAAALVPSLILQPLVENTVKHGVSRTNLPIIIAISAAQAPDGRLRILVEDNGCADGAPSFPESDASAGLGIGLANVSDRLRARFGDVASCTAAPRAEGGFRAELLMPLILG